MFDVLGAVVAALDRAQIPHMVSGSIASARHGEARSTQDIDLVIDPTERQMEALLLELDRPNYYVGDGLRALSERSQFYVIDTTTGWKVDLMIRRDRPFSVVEFARRSAVDLGGVMLDRQP